MSIASTTKFTELQGQYLAFIYYYTKIHRQSPAEADMQRYFQVSPPAVHQMILSLEKSGLIEKIPGQGRSLKLLLARGGDVNAKESAQDQTAIDRASLLASSLSHLRQSYDLLVLPY